MLGERIREIRMEMGLTAKELAQRASVTPGYISQIEHDQIKPSMNVMMRIAEVLNVPMAALLMAEQAPEEIVVTPRSARTKIKFADVNTEYEFLTPFRRTHDRGNQIEVIHYSLSPRTWGSATAMLHPEAAECSVVLQGVLEYHTETDVYRLEEGDCIYLSPRTRRTGCITPASRSCTRSRCCHRRIFSSQKGHNSFCEVSLRTAHFCALRTQKHTLSAKNGLDLFRGF